jgi:hypothetical protein
MGEGGGREGTTRVHTHTHTHTPTHIHTLKLGLRTVALCKNFNTGIGKEGQGERGGEKRRKGKTNCGQPVQAHGF